ncbi:unnamed protein product [Thelazia callipaeda]|uniref:Uncharacterized protein n=1 Tax=Thelazia callipaeda TaxID=103827 RepID=A0A0N5D8M7_THECL|nr:unnamed protein product [Thelazia callipaeda]
MQHISARKSESNDLKITKTQEESHSPVCSVSYVTIR